MKRSISILILFFSFCGQILQSQNFEGLAENATQKVKDWAIIFDFEDDSCYPAPAISIDGKKNAGLKPTGFQTCDCRDLDQFMNANTFCRAQSVTEDGVKYEVIMYSLYFEKDQYLFWTPFELKWSHRHDWEYAAVWLTNSKLTHATYSAHGSDGETKPISSLYFDKGLENHVKVVYYQKNIQTHCMRFAKNNEKPDNELGKWVTPKLVEWDLMTDEQQKILEQDWGKANPPIRDKHFYGEIEKYLPNGYPKRELWENNSGL